MGSQQTLEPNPGVVTIPKNYPLQPVPGKLEILWDANYQNLYHKLSPYNTYNQSYNGQFSQQPFYYIYPDQDDTGLPALKKHESLSNPRGDAPIDVIRLTSFLDSGKGLSFLNKQAFLQTQNIFNETRLYNPLSVIVAAGMSLAPEGARPQRFIDFSSLAGIATSVLGNFGSAIFGAPQINPPQGTVGVGALPSLNAGTDGKGLIRAETANKGLSRLQQKWLSGNNSGLGIGFSSFISNIATSMFANSIPVTQPGITYQSDEGSYGLMIAGGSSRFSYFGSSGTQYNFGQLWIGGGNTIRKNNQYPSKAYRLFRTYTNGVGTNYIDYSNGGFQSSIPGLIGNIGYTIQSSVNSNKPGFRYGDSVGERVSTPKGELYSSSDIMLQFGFYADPSQPFPTKNPDTNKVETIKQDLLNAIADIQNANGGSTYNVNIPTNATVIRSGRAKTYGYDRTFNTNAPNVSPINYPLGVLQDYRTVPVVSKDLVSGQQKSYGLPTTKNFDYINTLSILDSDSAMGNWSPYTDDQIAFYFYDVVNQNYIPFRAANIKGLVESGNSTWEEMSFIGRADKVYSYSGFTRNVNFSFQVVVNSIVELAPVWQRINYLSTLIKPANYTSNYLTLNANSTLNQFMIPPMVMMTIGDLYKNQPILIQSVTTTVPEDAAWELLNEYNSQQWSYLSNYIQSKDSDNLYAQVPRVIDIGLSLILLEKERPIIGGANFGHAPRMDSGSAWNTTTVPNGGTPNKFNSNLVVFVNIKNLTPLQYDNINPPQVSNIA